MMTLPLSRNAAAVNRRSETCLEGSENLEPERQ
jgi:hypothetical protein